MSTKAKTSIKFMEFRRGLAGSRKGKNPKFLGSNKCYPYP
jgi:hypothetical protein